MDNNVINIQIHIFFIYSREGKPEVKIQESKSSKMQKILKSNIQK